MKTVILALLTTLTGASAFAEPAPLALEGNFHLVAGYKAERCAKEIIVKAERDPATGEVRLLEVFNPNSPNPNGEPMYWLANDGTSFGRDSDGGSTKSVDTVTDSAADNVKYEYVLGIRFRDSRLAMKLKHLKNGVDELDTLAGDLCDYYRD